MKIMRKLIFLLKENFWAEQSRWIATVPFLFALGIALYFSLPFEPNVWIVLGLFEFWLLLFYLFRHRNLHLLFVGVIIVFCGFMNIQVQTLHKSRQIEDIYTEKVTYIRGRISDISYNAKGKKRIVLENAEDYTHPLKGRYRLTLTDKKSDDLNIGQCVELIATLFPREPLPVMNGFRADRKYFYENLSSTGYASSEVFQIKCAPMSFKSAFKIALNNSRYQVTEAISKVLPKEQSGVADALLVGEQAEIPPNIVENYRNAGLAHILAVSGLHLGTIAALVFFVVRFLLSLFPSIALRTDVKKPAAVLSIIFSGIYLLVAGMAIPAQRAFIMTAVVFMGIIFNRRAISLRMVSFAAMVLLIFKPQSLISISFQLSFAAVYALVAFYETYASKLAQKRQNSGFLNTIFWYFAGIVICDLVASLATAPFALYHFHRLAVYTSLGNLLAGPIIAFWLMPAILLCLVTLPFSVFVYALKILGGGVAVTNHIAAYVSALPNSSWQNNALEFWAFILIVCGGYWLCIWQGNWRKWGLIPVFIGVVTIFIPQKLPDVVFSSYAEQVAVRNNQGELILLPLRKDTWLHQLWQENLNVQIPNREEEKKIKRAMFENGEMPEDLPLKCDKRKCIYRDRIVIMPHEIAIDDIKVDVSVGGYIYIDKKCMWRPIWGNDNRLWRKKMGKGG